MSFKASLSAIVLSLSACAHALEISPQKLENKVSTSVIAPETAKTCIRSNPAYAASYSEIAIPDSFLKYIQKNDVFEGKVWDMFFVRKEFEGKELNVLYFERSGHDVTRDSVEIWADNLAIRIGRSYHGEYSLVKVCLDSQYSNAIREKVELRDFEGSLKIEAEAREFLERLFEEFKYVEVK